MEKLKWYARSQQNPNWLEPPTPEEIRQKINEIIDFLSKDIKPEKKMVQRKIKIANTGWDTYSVLLNKFLPHDARNVEISFDVEE